MSRRWAPLVVVAATVAVALFALQRCSDDAAPLHSTEVEPSPEITATEPVPQRERVRVLQTEPARVEELGAAAESEAPRGDRVTVRGAVVEGLDGSPVVDARIDTEWLDGRGGRHRASLGTDERGEFELHDVLTGFEVEYQVTPRPGGVTTTHTFRAGAEDVRVVVPAARVVGFLPLDVETGRGLDVHVLELIELRDDGERRVEWGSYTLGKYVEPADLPPWRPRRFLVHERRRCLLRAQGYFDSEEFVIGEGSFPEDGRLIVRLRRNAAQWGTVVLHVSEERGEPPERLFIGRTHVETEHGEFPGSYEIEDGRIAIPLARGKWSLRIAAPWPIDPVWPWLELEFPVTVVAEQSVAVDVRLRRGGHLRMTATVPPEYVLRGEDLVDVAFDLQATEEDVSYWMAGPLEPGRYTLVWGSREEGRRVTVEVVAGETLRVAQPAER